MLKIPNIELYVEQNSIISKQIHIGTYIHIPQIEKMTERKLCKKLLMFIIFSDLLI